MLTGSLIVNLSLVQIYFKLMAILDSINCLITFYYGQAHIKGISVDAYGRKPVGIYFVAVS